MGMDISKLPSNSDAVKKVAKPTVAQTPTEKKTQKVVTGKVTTKKNEVRKFTDIFVAEDASSVWDYLLHEMIIPTTKNLIVDLGQSFIERMILGGRGGSRSGSYNRNNAYNDYSSYSRDDRRYASPGRSTTRLDYEDIVFNTAADANAVLDQLDFYTRKYGLARVSDLYDVSGLTAPHTAHNYGWTNLNRARVVPCRGGFMIELPKAAVID